MAMAWSGCPYCHAFVLSDSSGAYVKQSRAQGVTVNNLAIPAEVRALMKQSCADCHSNETVWPWYSYVAPVSCWSKEMCGTGVIIWILAMARLQPSEAGKVVGRYRYGLEESGDAFAAVCFHAS
jgi:heme-binding protein